jgi:hypothetical protein
MRSPSMGIVSAGTIFSLRKPESTAAFWNAGAPPVSSPGILRRPALGIEIDTEAAEKARQFCARVLSLDLNRPDWSKDLGETG